MELDGERDGIVPGAIEAIPITPKILSVISELDEFKGAWRAIGRIAPERLSRLRRIATIESVGSSTRIEGAQLTNLEVEKLLSALEVKSFSTRDEQEVAGYASVMEAIYEQHGAMSLTENHIRQLHRDLLVHSSKDERHRGSYKKLANHVEAFDGNGKSLGVVFATATPFETPSRMTELVEWFRASGSDPSVHPLLAIGIFVVVFLEIHPFQDGNGRLSRVLTALLLLRAGYSYVPYSSLESIIEENKEGYYLALRKTQGTLRAPTPDWNPWFDFFLRSLQSQKRRLEKKMEREKILLGALPDLSVVILELARERGRVTVADAANVSGTSRHTVKDHLKALVRDGHLRREGAGRGTWYRLS